MPLWLWTMEAFDDRCVWAKGMTPQQLMKIPKEPKVVDETYQRECCALYRARMPISGMPFLNPDLPNYTETLTAFEEAAARQRAGENVEVGQVASARD